MGKPYSMDLRERVVAAVDPGGLSCHRAAAQFGVGVNTAILWVRRFRETGCQSAFKFCRPNDSTLCTSMASPSMPLRISM
jgi:transposase